jgi:bifunctional UDP-N-acetylglucosamine pyrophosphorylase/glucosamine-1-phosphate N-acetyltransferase
MLEWVLRSVSELQPERTVVVLHHGLQQIVEELELGEPSDLTVVDQGEPRGTGHAVLAAKAALSGFRGEVMVVYGDSPLMTGATLERLRVARGHRAASLLVATPTDPEGLGRILRDDTGWVTGIREQKDCSPVERAIPEINTGFYCFEPQALFAALAQVTDDNVQREIYLTDVVGILAAAGQPLVTVACEDESETLGVNTLEQLAAARTGLQQRILLRHLANGVLIEDPATTYIDDDVEIGAGTRVFPCTAIRNGVRIGANCEVGPFAHLRGATVMETGAQVGNFVEVKKSVLGAGAKAKHLTYLGDATIGKKANIGAGTVTANYDGKLKHQTRIGDGAFIGSGTIIVAPATVGDRAVTGAGALVTRNTEIGAGAVYVGVPARPLAKKPGREER